MIRDQSRFDNVAAIGVDETRFLTATQDRPKQYMTGFVDITPGRKARLLDVIEGRSGKDVSDWLERRPDDWLHSIETVALDPHRGYANGLLAGGLDHATFVLDHFHNEALYYSTQTLAA